MTLLIGSCSPKQVVVTADGICMETKGGYKTITATDLTKVFPKPKATVAIAHHGENLLQGKAVQQVVADEYAADPSFFESAQPDAIADRLATDLDSIVRWTMNNIAESKNCAFWVCGFERGKDAPAILEVKWQKEPTGIAFAKTPGGDLFLSGSGQEFIKKYTTDQIDGQFSWDKLWNATEHYHVRYHEKLWRIAEQGQVAAGQQVFGGKKIRLVITPSAWHWETAP